MKKEVFNQRQVEKTLKLVVGVLGKNKIEYRVFGSVIPAAINGRLHRELGDIDLLVDEGKKVVFVEELCQLGYRKGDKGIWQWVERFNLFSYLHESLLGIGFFAVEFGDKDVVLSVGKMRARVDNEAVKKTRYGFGKVRFWGIPEDTAYRGALLSKWNPKRVRELGIFKENKVMPRDEGYLRVYFQGKEITWAYNLLNWSLNWLGRLRVRLGMSYDFWR